MMRSLLLSLLVATSPAEPLFDGKSLDGWELREGEEKWWTVADGVMRGGSLDKQVPYNTFLASEERYANFELRLKVRLVRGEGFMNSGIQIRSQRVPESHEMIGYQVDAGTGWWGKLYDESRRKRVIGEPVDPEALAAVVEDWGWNEYRIRCEGPRIRTWINGVAALDYTEQDAAIPLEGRIGLQAHGGGKFLVEFKDVEIERLPETPGAPKWPVESPRSAADQLDAFRVPEGFEVELVASEEEGVGKPVTVAWDAAGRLWTMTAYEYPVDANENQLQAEALYLRGGKDKVLVFDEPYGPGPHQPRVFAEGLAIPLGILPWDDGVLVQYGHQIRHYRDLDGDGRADGHDVVLTGFGIQDSHLFPHQFERAPGRWIYLAQGLFNRSQVRRPDGSTFADGSTRVRFDQCKLARFKPDGSDFEILTAGPNNIWGLAMAEDGEVFLQEANDLGIPVAEFLEGTHYQTGSKDKLRAYAPQLPMSLEKDRMGGTGLSGLAIAEDEGSAFAEGYGGRRVFYLANPITNRIQVVSFERDERGRPVYRKEQDFLTSDDDWFRPVAVHFGPDGALYVVDWYNKIISHNEVPRTHPDRDKTRGRIWRIKPRDMELERPVDLTKATVEELVAQLGAGNARLARMAWQELGDRGDEAAVPLLEARVADAARSLPERLGAFWALEEMGVLSVSVVSALASDAAPQARYEAVRAAGLMVLEEADFVGLVDADEADFRVLAAWANALRHHPQPTLSMLAAVSRLAELDRGEGARGAYERDFLRYLLRWAMEEHREVTRAMLAEGLGLGVETRLLVIRSLPPEEAAVAMLGILPQIGRPLASDELELIGAQLAQPAVAAAFGEWLARPATRESLLRTLLELDPQAAADPELRRQVGEATAGMIADTPGRLDLAVSLARRFRLSRLAPDISGAVSSGEIDALEGLRALNEIGAPDVELCRDYLDAAQPEVVRAAVAGLAKAGGAAAVEEIAGRWESLDAPARQLALDGMLSAKGSAEAFLDAAHAGSFEDAGGAALGRLVALLGREHPKVAEMIGSHSELLQPVIRLHGGPDEAVLLNTELGDTFTLEGWVRLDADITNADNLLGRKGGADINFHVGHLRVWADRKDHIVAAHEAVAGVWTHYAVTRDAAGRFAIYVDGERDPAPSGVFKGPINGLQLGESNPAGGSAASYLEMRIWNHARTPEQIREHWRTRFGAEEMPEGLVRRVSADTPGLELRGGAAIEWVEDFPELRTPEENRERRETFERYRKLAEAGGDPEAGRKLAESHCMICHQIQGGGIAMGPDLSGAGAMGLEALLRNVLYPNDQLESGYYRHDLTLKDGSLVSGFLVSEDEAQVTLRPIGADERVVPRGEIEKHSISKRTLMPEGLLESLDDGQVADLFSYLRGVQ